MTEPAVALAASATAQPADDWLLSVAFDGRRLVPPAGLPVARRDSLDVFFHGVLFDRADWLRELGLPMHTSDAAIVLEAYRRRGAASFERLRGAFAAAVFDRSRDAAIIARDPTGTQPLFHASVPGRTLFAATPRTLLKQPLVSRGLNRLALADHLCNRWPDREETFFEAVRRVPPGWKIELSAAGISAGRYWDPMPDPEAWLTSREAEAIDRHLDRAVTRCLEAGPCAIFLSGGFDSVSVAAVAADRARAARAPAPLALSLGFPDPDCDERTVQRGVADRLGLPLHLLDLRDAAGPRGLLGEGLALSAELDAPLLSPWMPAYRSLLRLGAERGVRSVLTGGGGDEWMGVTPYLAADLIRTGRWLNLGRFARLWHRSYPLSWPQVLRGCCWTYGLRPLASQGLSRLAPAAWERSRTRRATQRDPAWVAPDPLLRRRQVERAAATISAANPPHGFYAREGRQFLDHALMSWEFEEQAAVAGPLGARYWHPYWDVDLLTHACRTPPDILNRGGRAKGQVRERVTARFPGLGFEHQRKVSALGYLSATLTREGPGLAAGLGGFQTLAALGVIDSSGATSFAHSALRAAPRPQSRAWTLVALEAWARTHAG